MLPRRGLCRAARGGDARRVRAARRHRHRDRHASRDRAAVFEPFFTTKEVGTWQRPRVEHGLRLRQTDRRAHQHLQPGRARHMREAIPAAGAVLPGAAGGRSRMYRQRSSARRSSWSSKTRPSCARWRCRCLSGWGCGRCRRRPRKTRSSSRRHACRCPVYRHRAAGRHERDETRRCGAETGSEHKVLFTTGYAREAVGRDRWLQEKVPWLLKPYSHHELARELKALLAPTVH